MNHREKILLKIVETVQGVDGIKKVVRQRPTFTEFKSLSNQLFPMRSSKARRLIRKSLFRKPGKASAR